MLEKTLRTVKTIKTITRNAVLAMTLAGCVGNYYPTVDDCVGIKELHYDSSGRDNQNLNGEYVIFKNYCEDADVHMTDWEVQDNDGNQYIFPQHMLGPSNEVCLRSGTGQDSAHNVHWGSKGRPIWNNDTDTLYLFNELGGLVLEHHYDNRTR
jgi:hypothetical protein